MKNGQYWKQRFKQLEEAQNDASLKKVMEIQEQFDKSLSAIGEKINVWYQRLAYNNGVSMQEARRLLDKGELKEFKWNVEEYIKYAKDNETSGAWVKQLENASARVHISRLEALKIQTQQEMERLFGNCIDGIDKHIQSTYTNDFYHTAFEIQKGIGVGTNIQKLNPDYVEKIISKPWAVDRKNFSDRLWENKIKLINEVHNSLSRMCITGESPDRAIKEIAKRMNVSKSQAGRLVMTESAAFANKARQDCMNSLGVEEFEVVETLDSHTCETCGGMDGNHYPMNEFAIGVTAPPFHPNCRGCTCPYFDDEFTIGEKRAARGSDGKTYYVPADTTYNKWKKAFVDDGDKEDFESPKIRDPEFRKANDVFTKKLLDCAGDNTLANNMIRYSDMTDFVLDQNCQSPFLYSVKRDEITFNPDAPNYDLYDLNYVQAHELSHRMDIKEYHSWNNRKFKSAVATSVQRVYDYLDTVRGWFSDGGKYEYDMALSDIISALTRGNENDYLIVGHDSEYWKDEKNIYLEIFANMCSMEINGYDSLTELKEMFGELYDAFCEMVK